MCIILAEAPSLGINTCGSEAGGSHFRHGRGTDHGVVVRGRRAARDLLQLGVVVGKSALASDDVPTAGVAERRPGEVRKPRLLTPTGHSQAKEK